MSFIKITSNTSTQKISFLVCPSIIDYPSVVGNAGGSKGVFKRMPLVSISELPSENSGLPDTSFKNTPLLPDEEDEHARIMARVDELEKEELEAGSSTASDQDEDSGSGHEAKRALCSDEDEDTEDGFRSFVSETNITDDEGQISKVIFINLGRSSVFIKLIFCIMM